VTIENSVPWNSDRWALAFNPLNTEYSQRSCASCEWRATGACDRWGQNIFSLV